MPGATPQTIQDLLQQSELVLGGGRIPNWWTDDGDLVLRKLALTKCIIAVALLQQAPRIYGHAHQVPEGFCAERWSKLFGLRPVSFLVIAKYHDQRFCPDGQQRLILLDCDHTHDENGFGGTLLPQRTILS